MKYTFSTPYRMGKWSYEKEYDGKYMSQVFDENNHYVKAIIKDTQKEVYDEIEKIKKEGIIDERNNVCNSN